MEPLKVQVRRSARRRRSISARREGQVIVVQIPATLTKAEEQHWVAEMVRRIQSSEGRRRRPHRGDDALAQRAKALSKTFLDGRAEPASVRWVANQQRRWGSCSPTERTIRLSDRLQVFPRYVIDYVLLHELIHLLHHGHGPDFTELLARYPQAERAEGFLQGAAYASADTVRPDNSADSANTSSSAADCYDETSQGRLFP